MKQKIVIKLQNSGEKYKTKAMQIGAEADGVISVGLEGEGKDQLVVIGEGVDAAELTCKLRKKLCYAFLLNVEEVKEEEEEEKKEEDKPKLKDEEKAEEDSTSSSCCCQSSQFPWPMSCEVVYVPNPTYCWFIL